LWQVMKASDGRKRNCRLDIMAVVVCQSTRTDGVMCTPASTYGDLELQAVLFGSILHGHT
ncbi:MAG TPA: hypothetical protein PKH07_20480, partial [bacterium]|nr:hypothetical protein [bacterium]